MLAESPNLLKRFPFFVHRCGRNFVRLVEAVVCPAALATRYPICDDLSAGSVAFQKVKVLEGKWTASRRVKQNGFRYCGFNVRTVHFGDPAFSSARQQPEDRRQPEQFLGPP